MNVFVIPEDFRKDQYVLLPVIRKMCAEAGKPNANVRICMDPLLGGISKAMKWDRIQEILEARRGMVQVFLLIVDRDGIETRRAGLDALEMKAAELLGAERVMFAENAWQEVEVWALAGQDLPKEWKWNDVRSEIHPKEKYFDALAKQRGLQDEPGAGRTTMGREAARDYGRVRQRCPEDVRALEERLRERFAE